jgi:Tfp pilus assembly protein PilN
MNAVNLIPADARKRRNTLSASPITLVVIGVLVAALGAAVLYVSTVNEVTTRRAELASVNASVTSWQAAASSFGSVESTAAQRQAQLAQVRNLADGRYAWSQLLSQIGGLMPAKAALTSLQATTASAATATASSTAATSTTAAGTPAAAPAPTATLPSITLSGCASSQSMVAETMVQLHKVTHVSSVNLASATDSGSATGPSGGSSTGGCPFPVTFQVSLTFSAPAAATSATAVATTSGAATTPATTPAATTPTGAAQ